MTNDPKQLGLDEIYESNLDSNQLFVFPRKIDYTSFKYLVNLGYNLVVDVNTSLDPKNCKLEPRICDQYSLNELPFNQLVAIDGQQKHNLIKLLKWKLIQSVED